jgi:alpha-galactosidase
MDAFTVAVLTNDEALAINQDPLGKPAGRILKNGQTEVWARPLFDGTTAVGLFNRSSQPLSVKVAWSDLKREGPQAVRDLWQHKDLGEQADGYEATVAPHGTVLLKVGKK